MTITSKSRLDFLSPTRVPPILLALMLLGTVECSPTILAQAAGRVDGQVTTGSSAPISATPAESTTASQAQLAQPTFGAAALLVSAGDLLEVQVFGTPELSGRLRVDQSGNLNLPIGGVIHVAGLTAAEVGTAIANQLKSERLMKEPLVTVFVTEYISQGVAILGEVRKPGPVAIYGSQTLYNVLAAAGGTTQNAGKTITITHQGHAETPEVVEVHSANYQAALQSTAVRPGDTVVVSTADIVYVLGAVNKQGPVPMPYGSPLSLLNVLSISSGLTPVAAATKAAIVRQTPTGVETINVNLKRVLRREDPNILMLASDILVIPQSGGKILAQTLLPSLATTATSAAVTSILVR